MYVYIQAVIVWQPVQNLICNYATYMQVHTASTCIQKHTFQTNYWLSQFHFCITKIHWSLKYPYSVLVSCTTPLNLSLQLRGVARESNSVHKIISDTMKQVQNYLFKLQLHIVLHHQWRIFRSLNEISSCQFAMITASAHYFRLLWRAAVCIG